MPPAAAFERRERRGRGPELWTNQNARSYDEQLRLSQAPPPKSLKRRRKWKREPIKLFLPLILDQWETGKGKPYRAGLGSLKLAVKQEAVFADTSVCVRILREVARTFMATCEEEDSQASA